MPLFSVTKSITCRHRGVAQSVGCRAFVGVYFEFMRNPSQSFGAFLYEFTKSVSRRFLTPLSCDDVTLLL